MLTYWGTKLAGEGGSVKFFDAIARVWMDEGYLSTALSMEVESEEMRRANGDIFELME